MSDVNESSKTLFDTMADMYGSSTSMTKREFDGELARKTLSVVNDLLYWNENVESWSTEDMTNLTIKAAELIEDTQNAMEALDKRLTAMTLKAANVDAKSWAARECLREAMVNHLDAGGSKDDRWYLWAQDLTE